MNINKCPECESKRIDNSNNYEKLCKSCGLVLDDFPFEKHIFDHGNSKRYMKIPSLVRAETMQKDGKIVKRIWILSTREKNLLHTKRRLDIISSKLNLPDFAVKEIERIFNLAVEMNLNIGKDNMSLLYACVYLVCIVYSIPKTPKELTIHSKIKIKKIFRQYKLIKNRLNITVKQVDFIPRFGSRAGISQKTQTLAKELIIKLKGKPVMIGKMPHTIAASCLYLASKLTKEKIKQKKISTATNTLELTIRKQTKQIKNLLNLTF